MNIILFGPQGSGKGTQAEILVKKYKMCHISVGALLRLEVKNNTPFGQKIASIVNNGNLIPDEWANEIALKNMKKCKKGFILDGYPRTSGQWLFIAKNVKIDAAIEIDVSERESLDRMSTRRICPKCQAAYNVITSKPKKEGICDKCKVPIVQRDDDKPNEIRRRLELYRQETSPLREYYDQKKILYVVDGNKPVDVVATDIEEIVKNLKKKK